MKNIWKWLLGIFIVLVIVGVVAGAAFMWRNHISLAFTNRNVPSAGVPNNGPNNGPAVRDNNGQNGGPMMRGYGWNGGPMMRGNDGFNGGPMMRGRGGFGFLGPIIFIGGLLKLAFFVALLFGAYWLGKRNARIALDPRPAAPAPKETE